MSRANSKPYAGKYGLVMEAAASIRTGWSELGQVQPGVSIGAIIYVISQRHSIWPIMAQLAESNKIRPKQRNKGGKQRQGRKGADEGERAKLCLLIGRYTSGLLVRIGWSVSPVWFCISAKFLRGAGYSVSI